MVASGSAPFATCHQLLCMLSGSPSRLHCMAPCYALASRSYFLSVLDGSVRVCVALLVFLFLSAGSPSCWVLCSECSICFPLLPLSHSLASFISFIALDSKRIPRFSFLRTFVNFVLHIIFTTIFFLSRSFCPE